MMNRRVRGGATGIVLTACIALAGALVGAGCGSEPSGACVRGTGITMTCGDDFTSEQCDYMGGDTWHEDRTCADLGFVPGKAAPRLAIAGVARDETGRLARVTLLNAGRGPFDLAGFALEFGGEGSRAGSLALAGIVDGCATRDIAVAVATGDGSLASLVPGGAEVTFVALRGPVAAGADGTAGPLLTAVVCGDTYPASLARQGASTVALVGRLDPGEAALRASWPAESWYRGRTFAPAAAPVASGCDGGHLPSDAWRPLVAAYR